MSNKQPFRIGFGYRFFRGLSRTAIYAVLITGAFISLVPFLWMLSASVMTTVEVHTGDKLFSNRPLLQWFRYSESELEVTLAEQIPSFAWDTDQPNASELKMTAREYAEDREAYWILENNVVLRGGLVNYLLAWEEADFSEYLVNSVFITLITLSGQLLISILAAYAFARMKFPGRDLIFTIMLSTMMIPGMVLIIPNFLTVTWIGRISPVEWINNWPALTIPFMGSVFAIFLLRQFFSQIPDDLFDAAQIDGASHWQFLWRVALPLSTAPILVITVLSNDAELFFQLTDF